MLALSVGDHYVWMRIEMGEEMRPMRLSDANRETGGAKGPQVHRSHRADFDTVAVALRSGVRAVQTLRDGSEVPVSRARLPRLREAGLLPR